MQRTPDPRLESKRRNNSLIVMSATVTLLAFALSQHVFAGGNLDSLVANAMKVSLARLERSIAEVTDTTLFPTYGTPQLQWKLRKSDDWTSGFYPGCLWFAYEISKDARFESWARQWTASLEREKINNETHDLGFKFMCGFGNGLRLGKGPAYSNYRDIMLSAAATLAKRYDPAIGCLSSNWDAAPVDNSFPVIIDIMMNLELLFWGSQNGGPPSLAEYARSHAITTCRDFVRPDGGTYHIVRYDKNSGKVINKGTMQGAGNETTWSRGHAWGLYGMTVAYRYTKEKRFLDMAIRLSDYFLKHLRKDHVSNWDFQSDIQFPDVSATCIATAGLLELVNYIENNSLKKQYQHEAEAMLTSLCKPPYFAAGDRTNCLLDHSVQYLPIKSNVDVPAIFADYYFLEALLRYRAGHK